MIALIIGVLSFWLPLNDDVKPEKCEIARIYQSVDIAKESRVLTMNGSFSRATLLFEPHIIDKGEHTMNLTRKVKNLYHVEDTNIYIETRLCWNIGFKQSAKVIIEDMTAYTIGHVYFQ